MTIFLDYYLEDGTIQTISTMDDRNMVKTFSGRNLNDVITELPGIELIVTFERSARHIYKMLEEVKHYLDDYEIRKRWYDLHTQIRKETDKTVALSKIAKSTLGLGPQSKINRLDKQIGPREQVNIEIQITERLAALKQVFDYLIQNGQLSYEKHDETIWVELDVDENPIHSGI